MPDSRRWRGLRGRPDVGRLSLVNLDAGGLAAARAAFEAEGVDVGVHEADVADAARRRAVVAELEARGPLGILINAAGTLHLGRIADIDEAACSQCIRRSSDSACSTCIPLGRFARSEEVSSVVAVLATPRSSYMTEQTLNVNVNGGSFIV